MKTKYQVKCKIKKGDDVVVISGRLRDLKKTYKVDRVDRKHGKVFLAGGNIRKRHSKPNLSNQDGGIIEKAMPVALSSVAYFDSSKKSPSRIGFKVEGENKLRIARKSGTVLT